MGFDYYHDQTKDCIFLGSSITEFHVEYQDSWIGKHKHIEEEYPNSKFIFVGKDMDYGEFENLLNK